MYRILVVVLIVVPAVEIFGLLLASRWLGSWPTFLLIVITGLLGAYFAKKEGTKALHAIRYEWSYGQMPAKPLADAILVFAGGILLLAPGFFTDLLGFLMVLPYTRPYLSGWLLYWLQKYLRGVVWFR